ncbi:MAG TPA: hypothetical protein VK530_05160, partial [Candidatus Acidoferrum sp.]|nr:hypothetical protein [Candidatus Acidoferrum sp.]
MKKVRVFFAGFVCMTTMLVTAGSGNGGGSHQGFEITPIGVHENGPPYETSAAEIVTYDRFTKRLYVVNAQGVRLDVLSIRNPRNPTKVATLDISPYGAVVNSVAFHDGIIAVAVENAVKTSPGQVVLFNSSLNFLRAFPAGALPDMVTFSPDGRWLLVANEGEPN